MFHRRVEMSIGRDDFFRRLASVVDEFDVVGDAARCLAQGRAWTIRLIPLPDRRLGNVAVPRHHVDIACEACSEADGEAFMARFRRGFMRAGG